MMKRNIRAVLAVLCLLPLLFLPAKAEEEKAIKSLEDFLDSAGIDWDLPEDILKIDLSDADFSSLEEITESKDFLGKLRNWKDRSDSLSDEELREEIREKASSHKITLTEEQLDSLVSLIRKADSFDEQVWKNRLDKIHNAAETVQKAGEKIFSAGKKAAPVLQAVGQVVRFLWKSITGLFH